jgi:uncharacterized protein involved in exopolysaccharide biosynthesis/Mrp family chromosome partitioning ATPase
MNETAFDFKRPESTLRDVYYVLFRHQKKIVIFFCAVIGLVALWTFMAPEIYQSEAKLLIRLGKESELDPTVTGKTVSVQQTRENQINSGLEILRSRDLAEEIVDTIGYARFLQRPQDSTSGASAPAVVEDRAPSIFSPYGLAAALGLSKPISPRERVIVGLMNNVSFEVLRKTDIISISYTSEDPKLAQEVVAKLIDLYMKKHMAIHRASGSTEFFQEQLDKVRSELQQTEIKLRDLKNTTQIASAEEQARSLTTRLGTLKQQLETTRASLAESEAKVRTIEPLLAQLPETVVTEKSMLPSAAVDRMRELLYTLQVEEKKLVAVYKDESAKVQDIRRQIAFAKEIYDKELKFSERETKGRNTAFEQLKLTTLTEQANIASLRARAAELEKQISEVNREIAQLNNAQVQIAQLEREQRVIEQTYQKYSDSLQQVRLDGETERNRISNISMVQAATLPIKPVSPRKMLNLAIGLLLAAFGSLGLAFVSEYLDHTFRRAEDVEQRLGLPALISIPRVSSRRHRLAPTGVVPAVVTTRKLKAGNGDEPEHGFLSEIAREQAPAPEWQPAAAVAEYFETLQSRILFATNGREPSPRVIAVTSCHSGEGATTIASNLAVMLARRGERRVVFVDATGLHLRNGDVFEALSPREMPDIRLPERNEDIALAPSRAGTLDVLFSFSRYFGSRRLKDIVATLRNRYDFVILDAPPILGGMTPATWATLPDEVILVLEADRIRWEVANHAKGILAQAQANVLGVVLNKRRFPVPDWLYRAF